MPIGHEPELERLGTPLSTVSSVSRAMAMRDCPLISVHIEPEASRMIIARSAAVAGATSRNSAAAPAINFGNSVIELTPQLQNRGPSLATCR